MTTAVATIASIANIKNTTRKKRTTTAPFGNIYGVGVAGNNGSTVGATSSVAVSIIGATVGSAAVVGSGVVVIAGMRVGNWMSSMGRAVSGALTND
jgi:uncharacterized membrane protein